MDLFWQNRVSGLGYSFEPFLYALTVVCSLSSFAFGCSIEHNCRTVSAWVHNYSEFQTLDPKPYTLNPNPYGLVSEIAAGRGADVARAATSENEQCLLW